MIPTCLDVPVRSVDASSSGPTPRIEKNPLDQDQEASPPSVRALAAALAAALAGLVQPSAWWNGIHACSSHHRRDNFHVPICGTLSSREHTLIDKTGRCLGTCNIYMERSLLGSPDMHRRSRASWDVTCATMIASLQTSSLGREEERRRGREEETKSCFGVPPTFYLPPSTCSLPPSTFEQEVEGKR